MTKKALMIFAMVVAMAAFGKSAIAADATAGDAAAGEKIFNKKCKTCHTVEEGKHRVGPSLFGVVGRKAGSTDFKRYKGLKGADFVWNDQLLMEWIDDPKAFVQAHTDNKSTSMTFKLKDEKERADVVAYLNTVK
jgi:cytochrome c